MTEPMTDERLNQFKKYYGFRSDGDAHSVQLCCHEIDRLRAEVDRLKAYSRELQAEVERLNEDKVSLQRRLNHHCTKAANRKAKLAAHEEAMLSAYEELRLWLRHDTSLENTPAGAAKTLRDELLMEEK